MRNGMMILVYVDHCIIVGKEMSDIDQFIFSMQNGQENFVLTDEGSTGKILGIEIKHLGPQAFEISQPFLIDRMVIFLGLKSEECEIHCSDKFIPAPPQLLNKYLNGKPKEQSWNYRTVVGMLSYLQGHTRPDISVPVHQQARFSNDPKLVHNQAITQIGGYFLRTKEKGIKYKIDKSKG